MLTATRNLVLPTTITGSLPRPCWYTVNLGTRDIRDALTDNVYREQYYDACSTFIRDQERAGLDILTDGDCRFDNDIGGLSWIGYPARRFGGLEGHDLYLTTASEGLKKGDILHEVIEGRMLPRCVGPVSRQNLAYPLLWKIAQSMTRRPVKFGTVTAEVIGMSIGDDYYHNPRALITALSEAMNEELLELARAGCPAIQIEEPPIHITGLMHPSLAKELGVRFLVESVNRTIAGLRDLTEVWCHTCWGNPAQQRVAGPTPSYAPTLEFLDQLQVDVLTFECASTDCVDLETIARAIKDKKIAVGVIDHRALQVERPEEVAAIIRRALKVIPPERLIVSTDCGFGREGMSRRIAFYKMVALVRGANIIRRELDLPEADSLAADGRFAFA
jgi:5-methyltetrahydropteroyltriglutamate--homocysteine methyltransferase